MELGACRKWRFLLFWYEIVCYETIRVVMTISDSFCMGNLQNYIVGVHFRTFLALTKPQKFQPKWQVKYVFADRWNCGKLFNIDFDCHIFTVASFCELSKYYTTFWLKRKKKNLKQVWIIPKKESKSCYASKRSPRK